MSRETSLELETLTSSAALAAIARDWRELWQRCPDATPFQAPEWLIPWWRTFRNGDLFVLAFRRGDRLAGLVPLYIGAPDDGFSRTVRLLGSGNSDYLDALAEPGLEDAVGRLSFRLLAQHRERWDRCDFLELRAGSALLRAPAPGGWQDELVPGGSVSFLRIPVRDPNAAVPAGFLARLRYYERYAQRHGAVRFETADEANVEPALAALFRLHQTRWRERGEPGLMADTAARAFHRHAARGLLRAGLLRLYTMLVDGQEAASCYVLLHRRRAYYYLTGFDPAFRRLSPGHLVMHHALRAAAGEGARTFDLLRGREAYKARWQPALRTNQRRRLRHEAAACDRRFAGRAQTPRPAP